MSESEQVRPRGAFVPKKGGVRTFESDDERQVADIVEAIPGVPLEDYTVDGKPRVKRLEEILGEDITEDQRDQAFAIYEANKPKPEPEPESGTVAGEEHDTSEEHVDDEAS